MSALSSPVVAAVPEPSPPPASPSLVSSLVQQGQFRLSAAEVAARSKGPPAAGPIIAYPTYERTGGKHGIVHIGVGGFHRAHQAVYVDALLQEHGARDWFICGVGLQEGDAVMKAALAPQDYLYTVLERFNIGERAQVVGSITDLLLAQPNNEGAIIAKLASPDTRIVSLTITESGYYRSDATGQLEEKHPNVSADLTADQLNRPKCVYGYITAALEIRRAAGLKPFTVLSCDNIQGNGHIVRDMLLTFVRARAANGGKGDASLASWLEQHGAFPNCMVDRITPRTTPDVMTALSANFGIADAWPVVTEPFMQWVLEDSFCDGRPPFEKVGVQLVSDVAPYEAIKLRVLNASHTAVAYLSALAGIEYIHEAVAHPLLRQFLQQLMRAEVLPNLSAPAGSNMSVAAYAEKVLERFSNPALADQTSRIALDGSGKMPKFVLPSLIAQIEAGKSQDIQLLSLVVASWLRYLSGVDDAGRSYRIDDPLAAPLQAAAAQELAESAAAVSDDHPRAEPTSLFAFLSRVGVLPPKLLDSADFRAQVTTHLHMLRTRGALDTLKAVLKVDKEKDSAGKAPAQAAH